MNTNISINDKDFEMSLRQKLNIGDRPINYSDPTRIESFSWNYYNHNSITEEMVDIISMCENLEELAIEITEEAKCNLTKLSKLSNLKSLYMTVWKQIDISFLTSLQKLEYLEIDGPDCSEVWLENIECIAELSALADPENVGRLYEKLEKCPERNKRAMYMNTLEVLKNLDDGYLTRHRYVEED